MQHYVGDREIIIGFLTSRGKLFIREQMVYNRYLVGGITSSMLAVIQYSRMSFQLSIDPRNNSDLPLLKLWHH
jgi:hypothetical protein